MTLLENPTARFLMCRPEHFAVSYSINPWMEPERWTAWPLPQTAQAR